MKTQQQMMTDCQPEARDLDHFIRAFASDLRERLEKERSAFVGRHTLDRYTSEQAAKGDAFKGAVACMIGRLSASGLSHHADLSGVLQAALDQVWEKWS